MAVQEELMQRGMNEVKLKKIHEMQELGTTPKAIYIAMGVTPITQAIVAQARTIDEYKKLVKETNRQYKMNKGKPKQQPLDRSLEVMDDMTSSSIDKVASIMPATYQDIEKLREDIKKLVDAVNNSNREVIRDVTLAVSPVEPKPVEPTPQEPDITVGRTTKVKAKEFPKKKKFRFFGRHNRK